MSVLTNKHRGPTTKPKPGPPIWWLALSIVTATTLLTNNLQAWFQLWLIAAALWLAFKITSMMMAGGPTQIHPLFFLWVGMDATAFSRIPLLRPQAPPLPLRQALLFTTTGLFLTTLACNPLWHPILRGWLAVTAMLCLLHFGTFTLLARFWHHLGYPVTPLMINPWLANSPGNFWGQRWNRGFSDWTRKALFQPLVRHHGIALGTMTGFLVSGLIHDLVISWPARGGFGGPTAYFLIQGSAVLLNRRILQKPKRWRTTTTLLLVLLPAPLLFHPPFLTNVFVPMIDALTSTIQNHATN